MDLENMYYYFEKELPEILSKLPLGEEKYIGIYGIGMHTKRLLHRYRIDVGEIRAKLIFIDSKKVSLTEKYINCDVYNVCDIGGLLLDGIILSSPIYEDEMYHKIRELYGDEFKVYRFYNNRKQDIFQKDDIYLEKEKLKRTLRINFIDFYQGFDKNYNIFVNLLCYKYRLELSDEPEIMFCLQFGDEHKKCRNCKKVLLVSEVFPFDFKDYDYAIGCQYFENKKFFHFGLYDPWGEAGILLGRRDFFNTDCAKRKFCNFIYSNETWGEGAHVRKQFCIELSKYKHVDCPGKVLNNMENAIEPMEGAWEWSKKKFLKQYKFTIAFENHRVEGYTTEKIWHALEAGSIPIYWGDPKIADRICPESIINCSDFDDDFTSIIQRVKEIDEDDEYYMYMLRKFPLKVPFDVDVENLKLFLEKIISE